MSQADPSTVGSRAEGKPAQPPLIQRPEIEPAASSSNNTSSSQGQAPMAASRASPNSSATWSTACFGMPCLIEILSSLSPKRLHGLGAKHLKLVATGGYLEWRHGTGARSPPRLDQDHLLDFLVATMPPNFPKSASRAAASRLSQVMLTKTLPGRPTRSSHSIITPSDVHLLCRLNRRDAHPEYTTPRFPPHPRTE